MKIYINIISILLLSLVVHSSWADDSASEFLSKADSSFTRALKDDSNYGDAISNYCKTISRLHVPTAAVIYNLGNSLYLEGLYSEALVAYTKALTLAPGTKDIVANKAAALSKLDLRKTDQSMGQYFYWFIPAFLGIYKAWFLIVTILFLLMIWFLIRKVFKKKDLGILPVILLFFCLFQTVSNVTWEKRVTSLSFVIKEGIALRRGDSELFDPLVNLSPGTELLILKNDHNWSKVKDLQTRQTGWVERKNIMTFSDLIDKFKMY